MKRERNSTTRVKRNQNQNLLGVWGQEYTEKNSPKRTLSYFDMESWTSQGIRPKVLEQRAWPRPGQVQ